MRGSVFLPGSSDRRIAEVVAASDGLTVTPAGEPACHLRWSHLTASLGGTDDQMVFLRSGDGTTVCLDAQHLPTLRAAAGPSQGLVLEGLQRRAQGVGSRFHLLVAAAVLLVVALLGGAVMAVPWAAERTVSSLPISLDRQIGDAGHAQMDLGGPVVEDPLLTKAVQTMVARLEPHAEIPGFEYRVQVVRSDQVNAFALPGGRIVVFTGLLAKATRPEQVAGVLAHEMAHVTKRHGLQALVKQVGVVVGLQLLLGDASGLAGLASQGAMVAIINGYSREAEREADAEGLRLLIAAGLDPQGLPEFFTLLKDEHGGDAPLAWMSTHPAHDERIAALQTLIAAATLPAPVPLEVDWEAVRRAAKGP